MDFANWTRGYRGRCVGDNALHTEKLGADRELAERKFEFDKDLAERKFRYDRRLNDHRRRVELAENVLTSFYQVRDIFDAARFPGSFTGDGEGRPRQPGESEGVARVRDSYYVPIARMNKNAEVFSRLHSQRYRFEAYFGQDATKAFAEANSARAEIVTAAEMLIEEFRDGIKDADPAFTESQKKILWKRYDEIDVIEARILRAIEQVETICRPFTVGEVENEA